MHTKRCILAICRPWLTTGRTMAIRRPTHAVVQAHGFSTKLSVPGRLRVYSAKRGNVRDLSNTHSCRRCGLTTIANTAPSVSLVLAAFIGLPLTLWSYKCLMLVLFQRKIIYMGYLPPGTRTERLKEDDQDLEDLTWKEVEVESSDGVLLRGYSFRRESEDSKLEASRTFGTPAPPRSSKVLIIYFQGESGQRLLCVSIGK